MRLLIAAAIFVVGFEPHAGLQARPAPEIARYGASTATRGFKLSDGANLVIAVSTFIDRAGNVYPRGVTPDVDVLVPETRPEPSADAVLQRAQAWLRTWPSCGGGLSSRTRV